MWTALSFIGNDAEALFDNITIAVTSATGQLLIYYTIRKFGPVLLDWPASRGPGFVPKD